MNSKLINYCGDFALLSFLYLTTLFILTCIGFFIGIPITKLHFYVLTIIFIVLSFLYLKKQGKAISEIIFLYVIMFLTLAVSLLISLKVFDVSYDGQGYHQEALIQLYNGWNLFLDPIVDARHSIWISHYGKVSWIIGSIFYKLTGSIESAKFINIFVALPTIVYAYSVLSNLCKKKMLAIIISVILLINPVYTNQALTFYVDQLLYIGFIVIALSSIKLILLPKETSDYIILSTGVILLSNVKFTGLGYAGVLMLLFTFFVIKNNKLSLKKSKPIILHFLVTFIIAVFIGGFNPYLTNLKMGHPLYPLSGPNKVDIMTDNTPKYFRYDSTLVKFLKSYYGIPSDFGEDNTQMPWNNDINELKFKFKNSLKMSFVYDTRIGGFGPFTALFITFLLISSIYLIFKIKDNNRNIYLFTFLGVILTTLINPESWWARYVPQLWFLMCINTCLLFTLTIKKDKFKFLNNGIGIFMVLAIVINSYFPIKECIKYNLQETRNLNTFLSNLEQEAKGKTVKINFGDSPSELTKSWFTPTRIKLEKYNIDYEEAPVSVDTPGYRAFPNTTAVFIIE